MDLVYSDDDEVFRGKVRAILASWRPLDQILERSESECELLTALRRKVADCQSKWGGRAVLTSLRSIVSYEAGYGLAPLASLGSAIVHSLPEAARPSTASDSWNVAIVPEAEIGAASRSGALPARVKALGRPDDKAGTIVLGGEQAWIVIPGGIASIGPASGLDLVQGRQAAIVGEPGKATRLPEISARSLLHSAAIYIAFEQLGGAQRCLDGAVAYTTRRTAFRQPIGAFQSVKHQLADVYVEIELARSNAYRALASMDKSIAAEEPVEKMGAILARVSASDAYTAASKAFMHLQGAHGTVWLNEAHLHLRRARFLCDFFGSPDSWLDRIDLESAAWFDQYRDMEIPDAMR